MDSHQLVKHLIGLRLSGRPYKLCYLFMDVPGRESGFHWEELAHFEDILKSDGLKDAFAVRTYQGLFQSLAKQQPGEHSNWLNDRYG